MLDEWAEFHGAQLGFPSNWTMADRSVLLHPPHALRRVVRWRVDQSGDLVGLRRFGQSSGSSGVGVGLGRGRPDASLGSTGACSRMSLTGPQSGGGADPMYRLPLGSRHFTS